MTADAGALRNAGTPLYDALVAEYRTALRTVPGDSDDASRARRRALIAAMPHRRSTDPAEAEGMSASAESATVARDDKPASENKPTRAGAHGRQKADRRTRPA